MIEIWLAESLHSMPHAHDDDDDYGGFLYKRGRIYRWAWLYYCDDAAVDDDDDASFALQCKFISHGPSAEM